MHWLASAAVKPGSASSLVTKVVGSGIWAKKKEDLRLILVEFARQHTSSEHSITRSLKEAWREFVSETPRSR